MTAVTAPALPGWAPRNPKARRSPRATGRLCAAPRVARCRVTFAADRAAPARPRPPSPTRPSSPTSSAAASSSRPTAPAVVVTAPDGAPCSRLGAADDPVFPRSSNKPIQAVAMVRAGLQPRRPSYLALACASHSGEDFHLEGVRAHAGRRRPDRGRPAEHARPAPTTPASATAGSRAGRDAPLAGAELLRQARRDAGHLRRSTAGTPATYRDPDHPLQRRWPTTLAELAGEPVAATAVDGCGAPVMAVTLAGLARAFGRLAAAAPGTPEAEVADAMRAHPEYLGGTRPRRHRPHRGHAGPDRQGRRRVRVCRRAGRRARASP